MNRFALIPLLPSLRSVGRNDRRGGSADTDFNVTSNEPKVYMELEMKRESWDRI